MKIKLISILAVVLCLLSTFGAQISGDDEKRVEQAISDCAEVDYSTLTRNFTDPYEDYYVDSRGLRQGKYVQYFSRTKMDIREEGCYINNTKSGLWISYSPIGDKVAEGYFLDGKETGLWRAWYSPAPNWFPYGPKGAKFSEGYYKDGKLDGYWIWWWGNGTIDKEGYYKDGKEDGYWEYWHDNGQKELEGNYTDGKKIGHWKEWFKNGMIRGEGDFKDDKKDGHWIYYSSQGFKAEEVDYKDGQMNGHWTSYRSDGSISKEGDYINDECNGTWTVLDDDQTKLCTQVYKDDKLVGTDPGCKIMGAYRICTPKSSRGQRGTGHLDWP